jgi:uncharacterized Rmd1/YagE family protein
MLKLGYVDQNYKIEECAKLTSEFRVTNEKLLIRSFSDSLLFVAALIVSQSVGLEKYKTILDSKLSTSKNLLSQTEQGYCGKRKLLIKLANSLVLLRHEIIADMHLLDKPNMLWDDETTERLYNKLSIFFELKSVFEIAEFRLGLLKDDIMFLTDILNHKKANFWSGLLSGL